MLHVGFGRSRIASLAARLVAITVVIVILAVTIISTTALAGVYELARHQVGERHQTLVDGISIEIETRLSGVSRVVQRGAASAATAEAGAFDSETFLQEYADGVTYIDRLVIARDGVVLGVLPVSDPPTFLTGDASLPATSVNRTFFYEPLADGTMAVWATQETQNGLTVYARMRSNLLAERVLEASDVMQERVALVVDEDGGVIAEGRGASDLVLSSVEYEHDDSIGGAVSVKTVDGVSLIGRFADSDPNLGVNWRILVAEPRTTMRDATFDALIPAVLALILTGFVSVIIATIAGHRLIRPLKDLEARAYEGAVGAYVRPIRAERADEVGRLAEAFNMIALRLNSLHDLSQLLASSSHSDEVLDRILSATSHIVGTGSVAIYLFDDERTSLYPARARGSLQHTAQSVVDHKSGWLMNAALAGGPTAFSGLPPELAATFDVEDSDEPITCLTAPLSVADDVLGVILIIRRNRRSMTQAETEMIRTLSAQAAIAVHNAHLFAEESASRREAELMRIVAEHLARPGDLADSLVSVCDIACELLGGYVCKLAVIEPQQFGLSMPETSVNTALLQLWREQEPKQGQGVMLVAGQDQRADALLGLFGAQQVELIPVVRSSGPAGVFALFHAENHGPPTGHERTLAAAVAQQVALALENAFYFQEAQNRTADLETVFRISQAVSSSLQIKVVLNRVLDVVQKIFSADAVALMTYDESRKRLSTAMARGTVSSGLLHYDRPVGDDVIGWVFESHEPTRIDALDTVDDDLAKGVARRGLRSLLTVPLLARGRSIGVLSVFSREPNAFGDADMELLHTFASQAALAIDTANVYSREHKVASVLQSSILPAELPVFDELETSTVYLPSGGESEIGGDYYDVFRAPDDRIVAAMADVCGKGIEAATKTSMIKYTIRALVAAGYEPAQVLSEVNRMVAAGGRSTDIVTVWIGFLDVAAGEITHADGGHPPALLLRADGGEVDRLGVTGPLLGAVDNAVYEQESTRVQQGDVVLLYTDGVTEAREGNKFFGEGRVRRALHYGGSAVDVSQRLHAALDRFVRGDLRDDAAVLVLKIHPQHQETST